MKVFRSITALLIGAGLAASAPLAAQAQSGPAVKDVVATAPGKAAAASTAEVSATVTAIDAAKREVTLKRADGKVSTIAAGSEVRNFDQIKVGDTVHAKYTMGLALELKKGAVAKGPPTVEQTASRAPLGAMPAGTITQKITAMAEVTAVDTKNQTVTLKGPEGNEVDLSVQDPNQLKNIQKGDHVQVTYVEALAISVERTHVAAAK
jgi:hypothetical protein